MINRILANTIQKKLSKGKVIILYGARQVGKTTMLKHLAKTMKDLLWLNADNFEVQALFEAPSATRFKAIFKAHKIVIIDEAQSIKDIGLKLKIMCDELGSVQVIASGSSSFELANDLSEPLTGRKYEFVMFPLSFEELVSHHGLIIELGQLNQRLIFGAYPDVIVQKNEEAEILNLLADSYLFKDILIWNRIKKSDKLIKLLQALAFQIGNQVSYNELGRALGLNNETVERYIDLLEKSFIVYKLGAFSRNLRSELKKSKKIYFLDNGIRNAVIGNFHPVELRNDLGPLWENYLLAERKKYLVNQGIFAKTYFWRTHGKQEIDYIEERNGKLFAFEFKWSKSKKAKIPKTFLNAYPDAKVKVITPDNYEAFITFDGH